MDVIDSDRSTAPDSDGPRGRKRRLSDPSSPLLPLDASLPQNPPLLPFSFPSNKRRKVEIAAPRAGLFQPPPDASPAVFDYDLVSSGLFDELHERYLVNKHYSEVNPILRQLHQEKRARTDMQVVARDDDPERK